MLTAEPRPYAPLTPVPPLGSRTAVRSERAVEVNELPAGRIQRGGLLGSDPRREQTSGPQ
jgi:hypothetical protein